MSLFVCSVSFISIFVSVSFICSYGFYFQFNLLSSFTKVYNRDWSLVKRCTLIFFYIDFCAKSVMITNGVTDITSQPSRIDRSEQLPFSAADASAYLPTLTHWVWDSRNRPKEKMTMREKCVRFLPQFPQFYIYYHWYISCPKTKSHALPQSWVGRSVHQVQSVLWQAVVLLAALAGRQLCKNNSLSRQASVSCAFQA